MIRSLAFNAFFYLGTLLTAVIGIVMVPIPTPILLRGLLHHWARAVVWGMRWIGGMCAFRRSRPLIPIDCDHSFRSIATSVARVRIAPLDVVADVSLPRVGQARQDSVPVVNRRDPRVARSALTADAAARAGGPC